MIPNAVLICTRSEKYFFTSFVARDKTYLMLFRVWQNALLDQPMTPQEMWQWVGFCLDILLETIGFGLSLGAPVLWRGIGFNK